jgi:multidrug efflux pump subunit AcrA (membrane-fusion protein)
VIRFRAIVRRRRALAAAALVAAVAVGFGVSKIPRGAAQPAQPAPSAAPIPVVLPKLQSVTNYVEITGNAAAVNAVKLIARVEGYFEKIHYEDGALVKEGDLLFTIQQDQYQAQLQQAQAQVLTAQASLKYMRRPSSPGIPHSSKRTRRRRPRSTTGPSSGPARRRLC